MGLFFSSHHRAVVNLDDCCCQVEDAAALVVEALAADDEAFGAWQSRHKHQLRGSSRVLAALDAGHPHATMPLMADPGGLLNLLAWKFSHRRHVHAFNWSVGAQHCHIGHIVPAG